MKLTKLNPLKKKIKKSILLLIFSSLLFKFFVYSKFLRLINKEIALKNIEEPSGKWNKHLNFCSFFQISQFYLIQNIIGLPDFKNYSMFMSNKMLKLNSNKKFTDILLQSFFGKVIIFLKRSRYLLKARKLKFIEIKLKKKMEFCIFIYSKRYYFQQKKSKT